MKHLNAESGDHAIVIPFTTAWTHVVQFKLVVLGYRMTLFYMKPGNLLFQYIL